MFNQAQKFNSSTKVQLTTTAPILANTLLGAVKSKIMVILISLITLIVIGIYITRKSYDFEVAGFILCALAGIYLIIHLLYWSLASYEYNVFVAKRQAFIETLQEARKNNNQIELAAITKDVSEWNQSLAASKYNITVFLLKDYTDKRIEGLQPIR